MSAATILVVDDDPAVRHVLTRRLLADGYRVVEAETAKAAVLRSDDRIALVLLDYWLPDGDGLSVLKQIKERHPDRLVILLTGFSNVEMAVEAMRQGAYHYVNKPFNLDEVMLLVEKALETTALRRDVRTLTAKQVKTFGFDRIVGSSAATTAVKGVLRKIAGSGASAVLLTGESGTGKDLAANVLHYNGPRASKPFMNITCSALSEALLESELFGHERGAFTGADRQKLGLLEMADGGTVFLDEIGEMVPSLQAKLLRFLEAKQFRRVGGAEDIEVDVSVVAATNRDLADEVQRGRFRRDLFYRLNVVHIEMPALRDRVDDIPLLVQDYLAAYGAKYQKRGHTVSPEVMMRLQRHPWPGNIRELRNVMERAVLLSEGPELSLADFALSNQGAVTAGGRLELPPNGLDLEQVEKLLVVQALERTNWNKTEAAGLLGLNRDQIRYRIEKFHLARAAASNR